VNHTANAADRANRAACEIWFWVVFEPAAQRAYWFRYTTMAPVAASTPPRVMVWAAAFDAGADSPAVAAKHIVDIAQYATEASYSGSDRLCGPGHVIEVDGGMLGARTVRLCL